VRHFLLLLLLAAPAQAQLPQARLDRLFPLGGSSGSSVVVRLDGRDLDELTALHFDRPGFSVPPAAAAGTVEVRAVGRFGITAARLFSVERGLAEVLEKEPNDDAAKAQRVPLECAVNGTSDGEGDDFFRFAAKKGQHVVLDCQALRLDSTLRAQLVLSDDSGKEIARSRPTFHRTDPLLDIIAPADGDYVVQLHDATYAGGLPYRLLITTRPHVAAAFPPALAPGAKAKLTLAGPNLTRREEEVTAPAFTGRLDFRRHPPAASALMRGFQTEEGVMMLHADHPVVVEAEPNDSADKAQPIALPCVLCGRLDRAGDADWYSFALNAGEAVHVEAFGERLERPGDLFLLITDEKGRELTTFDDHGISFNALALFNRDPVGTFTAPAKGTYRLLVQDRYRQGGPRHTYAVRIAKPTEDFQPVAFHSTNPHPTSPLVRAGGSDWLEVCLNRKGFRGTAVIEAKGLPPGVTCLPVHVSPRTEFANVVFTAALDARPWHGAITLEATALLDGKKTTRPVVFVQRRWAIDNVNTSRPCREVCLAVREQAAYGLTLPATATATAGKPLEVVVKLRRSAGFTDKVQLTGLNLPPGFGLATTEVPAGKDEATVKLNVAADVAEGTYSLALRGDAQVPSTRDAKMGKKNVRVADVSSPLTLRVTKK
jgi:hypothetical protein